MHRMALGPEDLKFVNRWRLVVIGFYMAVGLVTVVLAGLNSSNNGGTLEAQKPANSEVQASAQ